MAHVFGVDVGRYSILIEFQRLDAASSSEHQMERHCLTGAVGLERVRGDSGPDPAGLFASKHKPPGDGGVGQYAAEQTNRQNGDEADQRGHDV